MRQISLGLGFAVLACLFLPAAVSAQYFGKNKVQYDRFEWKILETEHFQVYYYEAEKQAATDAAQMAERSYRRLSHVLRHEFRDPIPLVLYASHSQFQQTNIQANLIDEGTGGVTEFLKRRVYLPFTGSYGELEHVLSHELVHAFQVDILYGSAGQSPLSNPFSYQPPLWFMEGMAEYLSLGGVDPNTEMWMRDAALQGYLIPLSVLEYVGDIRVYRFGQSIWEYVARRFGEDKVGAVLRRTAQLRDPQRAFEQVTGITMEKLSDDWLEEIRVTYLPEVARYRKVSDFGRRLTRHERDASNYNVIPAVSPTGDKVAYVSDRGLSTCLYLSSALDGKDLGRLVKGERNADFESFRFFNSSSDWSPDGTRLAFPAKSDGRDALYIYDVSKRRIEKKYPLKLDAITSPSWSPDGSRIVFTGYQGGMSDLYLIDADGTNLVRLTSDRYADKDATWSPDGKRLAFSTDRSPETSFTELVFAQQRIAIFELETLTVTDLPDMRGKNISPFWSPDGTEIIFVSTRSGIPNLWKVNAETGEVGQLSDLLTGISGITEGSPPISVSRDGRRLVFSAFERAGWDIYAVTDPFALPVLSPKEPTVPVVTAIVIPDSMRREGFEPAMPVRGEPGGLGRVAMTVPPATLEAAAPDTSVDLVMNTDEDSGEEPPPDLDPSGRSEQPFHVPLAGIDTTSATIDRDSLRTVLMALPDTTEFKHKPYKSRLSSDYATTRAGFGSNVGFAGQAVLSFSDILGNKNVLIAAGIYGSILDSDILLQYTDLSHRINYGITLFQYRNDYFLATSPATDEFQSLIYRGAEFMVIRPFSKFSRAEFNLAGVAIDEKVYRATYYTENPGQEVVGGGTYFYMNPGIALVKDTAVHGMTGPIDGTRARLEVDHAIGGINFTNALLDYRTYMNYAHRYAFAVRVMGATSAGDDPQIFRVGGPFTLRAVDYGELEGSHLGIMNFELRFPFIDQLSTAFPLPFDWPSLRGVAFFDVGGAWGFNRVDQKRPFRPFVHGEGFMLDDLVAAYGVGLRMGLGFLVLRYDLAQPTNLDENIGHARHFFALGTDF